MYHSFHLWLNASQHVLGRLDEFPADRARAVPTATRIGTKVCKLHNMF